MANITDFRTRFPEFDSVTDDRINLFLADSELFVSEVWGDFRDIGIYYLTAHNLSIAEKTAQGATSGIQGIASKSVEGVSISYQSEAISESNAYYMSTSYGKRYIDMKMRLSKGNARLV